MFQMLSCFHTSDRYLHSNLPQYTDPSSLHRLSRVKQLPQPTNSTDILALLGDTADTEYPIYRTATGPDTLATLATGESHCDVKEGMGVLYVTLSV